MHPPNSSLSFYSDSSKSTTRSSSNLSNGSTEKFWKQKQNDLRSMRRQISRQKNNLIKPSRHKVSKLPAQSFRTLNNGRKQLSTIYEPKVIDQTNYRNYLKKRFPRITKNNDFNDDESTSRPTSEATTIGEYATIVKPVQKVVHVVPAKTKSNMLEDYVYFCENKKFSEDFVTSFIYQHLDEESIPDVLIDIFSMDYGLSKESVLRNHPPLSDSFEKKREKILKSALRPLPPFATRGNARPFSEAHVLKPNVNFQDKNSFRSISNIDHTRNGAYFNYEPHEAESIDLMQLLLREELPRIMFEIVNEAVDEESSSFLLKLDIADILAPYITDEVVGELIEEVCRRSIKELAIEEMVGGYQFDILQELVDELILEYGPSVARRAVGEDFLENLLDEIMEPIVDAEAIKVARDVLKIYDDRLRKRDLKEIQRTAKTKPLESMLIQYMIEHLSASDGFLVSSWSQHRFIDGTALDILLKQHRRIHISRRLTLTCNPLREVHRDIFTEDALEVIADELLKQVDADLCDLDFDEISDPNIKRHTMNANDVYEIEDNPPSVAAVVSPLPLSN